MNKPIHIFAAGKRPASNGEVIEFTQAMLDASVAAYDPAKHEAPFVKGHPKTDDPSYGWAASLLCNGPAMLAIPRQVEPAFAEDVKAGRWKKRSASFYPPDHPSNPVPGVYYLKHIGFLGAVPPAVKGMPDPEFAEGEQGLVSFAEDIDTADFADWGDVQNASLWRQLKNWLIGEKGLDVADKVIPEYAVATLEEEARKENSGDTAAAQQFTEPQPQGDEMSVEEKTRLAALETENGKLKKSIADFVEAQARTKRDALHAEHTAFAEGLVKAGKLLPVNKDVVVATLDFMAGQEAVVEFGEGDAKRPLLDAHKAMLLAQPKLVEFNELSGAEPEANAGVASFAAPRGYTVDPDQMATHNKAIVFAEKNKCDYITAVKAVT